MSELSLVPMDDLIEELVNRTDSIVIIGEKILNDGEAEMVHTFNGDSIKCLGLVEIIKAFILPDVLPSNEEEE